jgi:hypothetical protein
VPNATWFSQKWTSAQIVGRTPYYYVITDEFPYAPRLYRGKPDVSFRHGPPPGMSPPTPPELMRYRGIG